MNVEIGTETPIFYFWEYLFRNFGILSLQCAQKPQQNCTFMNSASGYKARTAPPVPAHRSVFRLRCESMSESEESGDEYQRDADAHMADSLNNIQPVRQHAAPDPPFSSPVNHPGEEPGFHTVRTLCICIGIKGGW
jgi:hypothetical protein